MRQIRVPRLVVLVVLCLVLVEEPGHAEPPAAQTSSAQNWPQKVDVTVGQIRTRIDGPKLWTLSGIDFQGKVMATEESAYGCVLTIRKVGLLGTAHFLDVPGKPGQVEKEQVDSLKLFVDHMQVDDLASVKDLQGKSFRMQRKSRIRALNLETTISIRDDILTETADFHAIEPIDLRVAYPWMYAWTPDNTVYVFGDQDGIRQRGTFRVDGKPVSQVIQNSNWMAVFNPATGKGSVCCFLNHPHSTEKSFLLVDAPGSYRKVAAYSLVDTILPAGFKGTYQSGVSFFNASKTDWEQQAQKRAAEIRATVTRR